MTEAVKKIIWQWLDYANNDLGVAKFLFENYSPKPIEIICYHCQQAAEKALKSVLIAKQERITKTHNLLELGRECVDIEKQELLSAIGRLNPYSVQVRYPNNIELTEAEAEQAIKDAEVIMKAVALLHENKR